MELTYGLGLAEELIKRGPYQEPFRDQLLAGMKNGVFRDRQHWPPDPHVCCFTVPECDSEIPRWALYGDGGAGFALVFDGKALARNKFIDCFPIIYDQQTQEERLREAINIAAKAWGEAIAEGGRINQGVDASFGADAAHALGKILVMHAATMKRADFEFEKEWRLMRTALLGIPKRPEDEELEFGVVANGQILRSFYNLPFEVTDLKGVIIGPLQFALNLPVVLLALEEWGYSGVEITEGPISLRMAHH